MENQNVDLYWMWLDRDREDPMFNTFPGGSRHLLGMRYNGGRPWGDGSVFWDAEGGWQFGEDEMGQTLNAGFATAFAGYVFNELAWTPKVTGVYWYGSGDDDPNDDESNTFAPYFPLAHAYWGVIDNLGGPYLRDLSLQFQVQPHSKVNFLIAYHWFHLASRNDALYNVGQAPIGGPTASTDDIGEELDAIINIDVNPNVALQIQFAKFFNGAYIDEFATRGDARQFFIETNIRY